MSHMPSTEASTQTCYLRLKEAPVEKLHDQHFIQPHLKYCEVVTSVVFSKKEKKRREE